MLDLVTGRCWAIRGETIDAWRAILARDGFERFRELAAAPASAAGPVRSARGGAVAVIPVVGTLTQRGAYSFFGSTLSTEGIAAQVAQAASDASIDAIVLELDTPGGEVFGVSEAWEAVRSARRSKPVVAAVNSMAASAGYWLATAADRIVVTPSGEVGSIGVYTMHVDESRALEAAGVKVTFVSAGKYKVEGNPAEPLADEARAAIQGEVDRYYGAFVADVARGRGVSRDVVRAGYGEGRMVGARAAVEQGMADEVGTITEAIRLAAGMARRKRNAFAAASEASLY